MKSRFALPAIALLISTVLPTIAYSQTDGGSNAAPQLSQDCRADLGSGMLQDNNAGSGETESLSEQLGRCNGVIRPPKVGDQEIVEPAPEIGTMPVIPPGALPQQNSDVGSEHDSRTEKAIEAGSGIDQIVAAIARSAEVADQLEVSNAQLPINVVNISVVFRGAKAAILKTALREHEKGLDRLRSVLSANQTWSQQLQANNVSVTFVVAAQVAEDGSLTVYVR